LPVQTLQLDLRILVIQDPAVSLSPILSFQHQQPFQLYIAISTFHQPLLLDFSFVLSFLLDRASSLT
jgi:hypothetical protein